jgi:4-hydroxyphenylpyruvate dioxygenase
MRTDDIITTVERMKARGVEFLEKIPDAYYDRLIAGMKDVSLELKEDIEILRKLKILVDYDEKGYLL